MGDTRRTKRHATVAIRATAEQRRRWEMAARADDRTISGWARRVLDAAARESDKTG